MKAMIQTLTASPLVVAFLKTKQKLDRWLGGLVTFFASYYASFAIMWLSMTLAAEMLGLLGIGGFMFGYWVLAISLWLSVVWVAQLRPLYRSV